MIDKITNKTCMPNSFLNKAIIAKTIANIGSMGRIKYRIVRPPGPRMPWWKDVKTIGAKRAHTDMAKDVSLNLIFM